MSKKKLVIAIISCVIGSSFAAFSGEPLKSLETSSDLSYKFSNQANPSNKLKKFLALALLLSHKSRPPKFSSNSTSPLKEKKLTD